METLLNLLKGFAPALATAAVGPAGGAVISMIANKFGVADTVAAVTQALTTDAQAGQKLRELDFEYAKLNQANTANARSMQIVALQQNDVFSKRFIMYLATFWSICAAVYIGCITFAAIPVANVRFADTILGFLLGTIIATILNFFFGSSADSRKKTDALTGLGK